MEKLRHTDSAKLSYVAEIFWASMSKNNEISAEISFFLYKYSNIFLMAGNFATTWNRFENITRLDGPCDDQYVISYDCKKEIYFCK